MTSFALTMYRNSLFATKRVYRVKKPQSRCTMMSEKFLSGQQREIAELRCTEHATCRGRGLGISFLDGGVAVISQSCLGSAQPTSRKWNFAYAETGMTQPPSDELAAPKF